jgi:hypothetical protein
MMNLMDFEATIREMADQVHLASNESAKHRVMQTWRAKLEKEPTSLLAFQIDEIIREVRKRLIVKEHNAFSLPVDHLPQSNGPFFRWTCDIR